MLNKVKRNYIYDILNELEHNKIMLLSAYSEFDNSLDELQIQAAIYRINELETRQRLLLNQIKGMAQ